MPLHNTWSLVCHRLLLLKPLIVWILIASFSKETLDMNRIKCHILLIKSPVFLVTCSDSISHYVSPSVGQSVGNEFTFLLLWFGHSTHIWGHWSPLLKHSPRNQKKSENFKKIKKSKNALVRERALNVFLDAFSTLELHFGTFRIFSRFSRVQRLSHYVEPTVGLLVGQLVTHSHFCLKLDHHLGPQSNCLGHLIYFWGHWSPFLKHSPRNLKKSENFKE